MPSLTSLASVAFGLLSAASFSSAAPVTSSEAAVQLATRGINGGPSNALQQFSYYTSTDGSKMVQYLTPGTGSSFDCKPTINAPKITVNLNSFAQPFEGVGVAITDATAINLQKAKQADSNAYSSWLKMMFDRYTGISIIRVPTTATDFSTSIWTMADKVPNVDPIADPVGAIASSFDASPAGYWSLPTVQDILAARSDVKVMLTPWSAPAWMKINGAADLNGFNNGTLKYGYEPVYAELLAQTIKAWNGAGVAISYMSLANEPSFASSYPSMLMNATQQSRIALLLRQRLAQLNIPVPQLLAHDMNFDEVRSAQEAMTANGTAFDGAAFHSYNGDPSAMSSLKSSMDSRGWAKSMHYTEGSAYNAPGANMISAVAYWAGMFANVTMNWSRTATTWNFALDQNFGPRLAAAYCNNCLGAVTYTGSGANFNMGPIAYANQHFAAITTDLTGLGPGAGAATRVPLSITNANGCIASTVAFAAPTGRKTGEYRVGLQFVNTCNVSTAMIINTKDTSINYIIRPGLHSVVFVSTPP